MIEISIIMPAYNAEKFIAKSIESVVNQTYTNWELIIIDDGSTDQTAKIILSYLEKDQRIKYVYQKNGKQGKARNNGIKQSIGNYIAFLDADDLWVPKKLEIQLNYLQKNPAIDLLFSQGYYLKNDELIDFDVLIKPLWSNQDIPTFIKENRIPILSVLLKKSSLKMVNSFNENLAIQNVEDYHLWLNLLINNVQFASIADRLFYYRIHVNQVTFNASATTLPIIRMFTILYQEKKILNWKKEIANRIKWGLFDLKAYPDTIKLLLKISKSTNNLLNIVLTFIDKIPNQKIKSKLLFKVSSWL